MKIQSMFADDINRKINGVIKVDQRDDSTEREIREYVITKELKKHFVSFFNYYEDAINNPTDDIGVWISGFFGSGKSHFLKMLSYILANDEINGQKTVEYFREKFSDDPATFMMIDNATKGITDTILFNIDIEGSIKKDNTAVLRVFAKMFYSHLGFYGENLKVAMLESYIQEQGKTEEFRRIFEDKKGKPWLEERKNIAFLKSVMVSTLMEVLGMSEADAEAWFKDKSEIEMSIARLVEDMKNYVANKPADYRLLFMIDEVGQYIGTDTDRLLNLQSLLEKIGSDCGGKIWVMCTGQEAIDEIIKVRSDEFSRIQARFKTRLSLSSSSVDEVIQKRVLNKTPEAKEELEAVYDKNESVLRNLFSFTDSVLDIKGYSGGDNFAVNFPFVPYQFIIMQKVFAEIRKHGNAGKHLSGGERSMLSGFQEAAQKLQERDEYTIVPFHSFYDTVHSFLDGSIRRVMERCEKASQDGYGIESQDIDLLKLLYLLRYIDDIKSNIDNLTILMADDLRVDKIKLKEQVKTSLVRLERENYIARAGEIYNFLTDEEQDIQKEINNIHIDTTAIVDKICKLMYADIYTKSKYKYANNDFAFDKYVDGTMSGSATGGMRLKFLTMATQDSDKLDLKLMADSNNTAIVVLADNEYYHGLEKAMKIRKYINQRNLRELTDSVQAIINEQKSQALRYEKNAVDQINQAILEGRYYAQGEKVDIKSGSALERVNHLMEYLVGNVYEKLDYITRSADSEIDVKKILNGTSDECSMQAGTENNILAQKDVVEFLELQSYKNLPTSMADIHKRFKAIPYGWKEMDIALVVARLIYDQKIAIKCAGETIQPNDSRLSDMLHKKSEIGKTVINKRELISDVKVRKVKKVLEEYFYEMDIPNDEDGLVSYIVHKFKKDMNHYEELESRYVGKTYPDRKFVAEGLVLIKSILVNHKDNVVLIDSILAKEDELLDNKEDMQNVESFFTNQVQIYDAAVSLVKSMDGDRDYLSKETESENALNQLRLLTLADSPQFNYAKIPSFSELIDLVRVGHNRLLDTKRDDVLEVVRQCMEEIHKGDSGNDAVKRLMQISDTYYAQKKEEIAKLESLLSLDGLHTGLFGYKDEVCSKIEQLQKSVVVEVEPESDNSNQDEKPFKAVVEKKAYKPVHRQAIFSAKKIETEQEIDEYIEKVRKQLKELLKNSDGIELK